MTTTAKETHSFQTEVKQLLNLMIHSLYSNKEIFLRELISNASDAADKLRFLALENDALYEGDGDLKVELSINKDQRKIIIEDNGIGMTRDDVVANLGTIAKSGTAEFIKQLGDSQDNSQLIGQFGVGFYSSFIVAEQVDVFTRKAGDEQGTHWSSKGEGEYDLEEIEKAKRGTRIELTLREGEDEFLSEWRLRELVRKYSDHVGIPVMLETEKPGESEDDATVIEWEKVNDGQALWTKSKNEISDDEYKSFYHSLGHDFADPLTWVHNRVEGRQDYTSLLYVPGSAPMDLYQREGARGLKLYVQRVFIMDRAEEFLPMYLRFIKGVVDSKDLSLNVSREILQQDQQVTAMKKALTKRALGMISTLSKDEEQYKTFWKEFGEVLKEGIGEDMSNQEKIAGLLRFATSKNSHFDYTETLDGYIERMPEGQEHIYYVIADSVKAASASPHIEVLKKKGYEVILLGDRIDEWMMSYLSEYKDKKFKNAGKGDLNLDEPQTDEEKKAEEEADKAAEPLLEKLKKILESDVSAVKRSHRLTDSPACLVRGEHELGEQMRKIMEAAGQAMPDTKPTLEVNVDHPLLKKIGEASSDERAEALTRLIYDQARIAEGIELSDPAGYVKTLNSLLAELPA
ncbi:molecular chaperone HtpG [Salinibius halmophilus]|uniref:molecular chaperone HtpG n=1 Tax=Salinibius halmophilus TaxID=1853216 RepID=UPI000E66757D|nr:molecular chaperone HtpG [Salinibius halmophilus]